MAADLSLVAGGGSRAAEKAQLPSGLGGRWHLPVPSSPTLSELFAAHLRDAGWAGFLLAQLDIAKPMLWVQDRMAILESGRVYPPGLPSQELIHVEARDARDALWAMEEGVRCAALSAVIGEIWGDPKVLDFTATRRLAVASERSGVGCWLVRLGGNGEPQRSPNALADWECPVAAQPARRAGARIAGMGRGSVPGAGYASRPLEHRA